jgi:arsenate reductase
VTTRRTVLFLCTGNSCRSQIAEALVNTRLSDQWQAISAGTQPAGYVHPQALVVLTEIGIQHTGWSKNVSEFWGRNFDLVVTVCDDAAENCPVWLGKGRKVHLSFPDPAKVIGSEEEILTAFRSVRDDMLQKIPALLEGSRN